MPPVDLFSPTFGAASLKPAPPKFGMIELGKDEYERAYSLHDAGVSLAKAGNAADAERLLLEAFDAYDSLSLRVKIALAIGLGVEPGLPPNPEKADELLERVMSPNRQTYMAQGANGWEQKTRYGFMVYDLEQLAGAFAQLAEHGDQFRQRAIELYLEDGQSKNTYGTVGTIQKLLSVGGSDEARALLVQNFDSSQNSRKHYPGDDNANARRNIDNDLFRLARLVGGIPIVINQVEPPVEIAEIVDGDLARDLLVRIAEQPDADPAIRADIMAILAAGKGSVTQDKDAARKILDSL